MPDPAPQSVYFGFSVALDAGWEAAFDSAGISIKLDEDQLPGSCRNWVTAENFAAMWDSLGGVALFVDEAPMVQKELQQTQIRVVQMAAQGKIVTQTRVEVLHQRTAARCLCQCQTHSIEEHMELIAGLCP